LSFAFCFLRSIYWFILKGMLVEISLVIIV